MSNPIYNNDNTTLGYWLDEDNGISQVYGFFHILYLMAHSDRYAVSYTAEEGNPIDTWEMLSGEQGEEIYNGMSYEELDNAYMDRSGNKLLRKRFLDRLYHTQGNRTATLNPIVLRVTRKYSKKWMALWETMFYDYNPIENYNMTENLIDQVTEFEHGHIEELLNGRTNTRTGDVKETPGVTVTETQSRRGYDSDTFVGSDQTVTGQTGFNKTEYENFKDTLSGTDKTTHSGTDTETKNYSLTRSGNIGVTTSQQMIEAERKLLMFDYFNNVVFPDIDKELVLSVY